MEAFTLLLGQNGVMGLVGLMVFIFVYKYKIISTFFSARGWRNFGLKEGYSIRIRKWGKYTVSSISGIGG